MSYYEAALLVDLVKEFGEVNENQCGTHKFNTVYDASTCQFLEISISYCFDIMT